MDDSFDNDGVPDQVTDDKWDDGDEPGDGDLTADRDDDEPLEGLSLDDLGAAYARAAAAHDPETFVAPDADEGSAAEASSQEPTDSPAPATMADDDQPVHPEGVIEAALFVGHPENQPFTAIRLASLMRDVTEDEVVEMIEALNRSYKEAGQALRILEEDGGYRLAIAPAVEGVRQSFLGKVREARLSQAAVEVLALVAYQPGITAQTVQDQRGKDSGSLLNQLVRRRLLEIKRRPPPEGGRKVPHYYPTERFLALFGLESLEDLPLVDERFLGH
jgi:segregation and condensation protein B